MMKNIFISSQKLFAFSRYLNFCLDFFGYVKKDNLIRKIRVNFKICYNLVNKQLKYKY